MTALYLLLTELLCRSFSLWYRLMSEHGMQLKTRRCSVGPYLTTIVTRSSVTSRHWRLTDPKSRISLRSYAERLLRVEVSWLLSAPSPASTAHWPASPPIGSRETRSHSRRLL